MHDDLLDKYLNELKSSSREPDNTDVFLLERIMGESTKRRPGRSQSRLLAAAISTIVVLTGGFVLAGGPQVVRNWFVTVEIVNPDDPLSVLRITDDSGVVGEITLSGGDDEGTETPVVEPGQVERPGSTVHVDILNDDENRLQLLDVDGNPIGEIKVTGSADGTEVTGTDED